MHDPPHGSMDDRAWYFAPHPWAGVANDDLNRLLGYLLLTGRARAYARKVAVGHSFPHPTVDFVGDICCGAAANARKAYQAVAGTDERLFEDEAAAARKGNGFLRFAFLQTRHTWSSSGTDPVGDETLEIVAKTSRAGIGDQDSHGGDESAAAVAEAATLVRSAVTWLVDSGILTCVHEAGEPCFHKQGTCPSMPVVLSVALQILASWERAWPPVEGLSVVQPEWEPPRRAKYAMLALADPDNLSARADRVPDSQRKLVERRWHCALQLVATARKVVT